MRAAVLASVVLVLAGCGTSPKTSFYMLTVAPSAGPAASSLPRPVQVAAVHIPPSLDRKQMVRMTEGQSVSISETDRWSAPFGDMVRNVLSEDLEARLPKGAVILPDAPAPTQTAAIVVTLSSFAPDERGQVSLQGSWALIDPHSETPAITRQIDLQEQGGPSAGAAAGAMSDVLGQLANDIASTLGHTSR
jgi:uncharacterized lipoprotein YmbA